MHAWIHAVMHHKLVSVVALTSACDKPPTWRNHGAGVGGHVCRHRLKLFPPEAPQHKHLLTAGHDKPPVGGHVQGNNGVLVELQWKREEWEVRCMEENWESEEICGSRTIAFHM